MSNRKIIEQLPGKITYECDDAGKLLCFFDDLWLCPNQDKVIELPGKGVLANRISALLGSKLGLMGIPQAHLGLHSMKESNFVSGITLPFAMKMHLSATAEMLEQFDLSGPVNFDPPLIEFRTHSNLVHATEDFLVAMGWTDHDELEDIQSLICRTVHCLQGYFAALDVALIQIQLSVVRNFDDDLLVGGVWPELMVLRDMRTQTIWHGPAADTPEALMALYYWLSQRLGVGHEGVGPLPLNRQGQDVVTEGMDVLQKTMTWPSNVLPFAPLNSDRDRWA